MKFEEAFPFMREGKTIKSKSSEHGIKLHFETFGCVDSDDKMLIANVDENGNTVWYSSLEATDLLKEDYDVIE